MEVFRAAVALIVRSTLLSARAAGQQRLSLLPRAVFAGDTAGKVARLRDGVRRLQSENRLLKARDADAPRRKRYTPVQRLQVLWHMEYTGLRAAR